MTELSGSDTFTHRFLDNRIYLERDVCFDRRHGRLVAGKRIVALNFHENTLLQLLLTDRVKKQRVIDAVWGANGTVVTEASYHQLVRSLRKKFDEAGLNPLSIKTLPRYGLEYLREHLSTIPATLSLPQALATVRTATIKGGSAAAVTLMSAIQRVRPAPSAPLHPGHSSHPARSVNLIPLPVRAYSEVVVPTVAEVVVETRSDDSAEMKSDIKADTAIKADTDTNTNTNTNTTTNTNIGCGVDSVAVIAQRLPPWRQSLPFFMLALPFIAAIYFGAMAYLAIQPPAQPIANGWGVHLFDIGGAQYDPLLMQEIKSRTQTGEYAYVARNGPKVWLGICGTPTQKEFSFCRQDYFSLY